MRMAAVAILLVTAHSTHGFCADSIPEEFRIDREEVFEFATPPAVTRDGNRVTITFESKGFCDATVAVEDAGGRIVRHLASGVLGPNAPAPFAKDSKKQALTWDGKDDRGEYVVNRPGMTVRVSLGLRPAYERTLFWSPKKRLHQGAARWGFVGTQAGLPTPRIAAAPEGVYVFEGRGFDHLRLFSHDGDYLRTIYPPPPDKLKSIVGLDWHTFPQDGLRLPLKRDILQSSLLSGGPSGMVDKVGSMFGTAATAIAVHPPGQRGGVSRIALVHRRLNRLAGDGGSGGLPLEGPDTHFDIKLRLDGIEQLNWKVSPTSAAFSPDGSTLYLAGYMWRQGRHSIRIQKDCLPAVMRLDYATDRPMELFAGSTTMHDTDAGDGRFRDPTSVDCDADGRVYVADYANDRIQVFSPAGKHIENIAANKPARIRIHRRTGQIYVFSWAYHHVHTLGVDSDKREIRIPPKLTVLGPLDDLRVRATYDLPLKGHRDQFSRSPAWAGLEYNAEVDSWSDPVTIWLVPGAPGAPGSGQEFPRGIPWSDVGIKLLTIEDGKLHVQRDFAAEAARQVGRLVPPMFARQRLYVNPKSGLLYVVEGQTTHYKAARDILEIDPRTGAIREVALPFDAEDMAFDTEGRVYLRTHDLLVRYEMGTWREIPFDYGEQHKEVGTSSSRDGRHADVTSGLRLYNGTGWHKGGLYINAKGNILASCFVTKGDVVPFLAKRTDEAQLGLGQRAQYTPRIYPGRLRFGELHVWDKHGQVLHADAVMGLVDTYGVGLDAEDNVYVMAAPTRIIDGDRYFNRLSGTLMKFRPGRGRIVSQNSHLIPAPVDDKAKPNRPHDIVKGSSPAWVNGAEWFYGGVGYCGKNALRVGGHCACYNSRFALDYFARSFAPEVRRFRVAVLDSSGNLILRLGQYGNADSRGADSAVPLGGDEIGLFHPAYVATDTDRRLFIADPGNARIVSVKLDYHATERAAVPSE